MSSLRRQLMLMLLGGMALVIAVAAALAFHRTRNEANELFDYQLRQLALSVVNQTFIPGRSSLRTTAGFDFVIQVWDPDGVQLYYSHPHRVLPAQVQLGYAIAATSEGDWRTYAVAVPGKVIQIAQPMQTRNRLALNTAWRTTVPLLIALPLLLLGAWWVIGRALRPLEALRREVAARTPDALAPLPANLAPDEVQPLIDETNRLLLRLGDALAAQRAFTANAAHELRTPLAALQLQLASLERAPDDAGRAAAIAELKAGLARAGHMLNQLLTLARNETASEHTVLVLAPVVTAVLAEQAPLAIAAGLDLGATDIDPELQVLGDADALRSLVANLVGNAIRYTPSGGRIDVALRRIDADGEGRAQLTVADSGPGIPEAEREQVFQRFYRRPGSAGAGSGLGLAIVRAVAEAHRAKVSLRASPLGGLLVTVVLPQAPHGATQRSPIQ
ncbi:ATP-binding protein [Jeongeupia chitinilytica]|uniref:histidine kinase n=1 Tax=Jeongeupia chitinilytica TaxID=1041641 RepID=A0ABQ3GXF3_9NEIS|nr:ATP-binding protein [Jeongeupia chitinilytica]GHD57104.1 two-component sensor histidine kinase [Jeongeupia chitinilytica]